MDGHLILPFVVATFLGGFVSGFSGFAMGIVALHPSYGIAIAQITPLPPQPFNFAIEAMSTFKFLGPLARSILRANQP